MRRRLLAVFAILSAAVWLLAAAAWVRSCYVYEEISWVRRDPLRWFEPVRHSIDRDGTRTRYGGVKLLWRNRIISLSWTSGSIQFDESESVRSPFPPDDWLVKPIGEWRRNLHQYRGRRDRNWTWTPLYRQFPRIGATTWQWVGFAGTRQISQRGPGDPGGSKSWSLTIPFWFLMLAAMTLPARWWRSHRRARLRRRRIVAGRCGECGYDMRTAPDRCPECGAARPANYVAT
jgi:hypothetical protein